VAIPEWTSITLVHLRIQEKLPKVWEHIFSLGELDELPLAGTVAIVQGSKYGKGDSWATRRVHVDHRRHRAPFQVIGIAAHRRKTA
jgi:hypothetical protein